MRSSTVRELEAGMATTGILKAAAGVQTIWLDCRWHGSIPWEKPEEPPASICP